MEEIIILSGRFAYVKRKAERNGVQCAKFLVNQNTYNALCRRGADKSMLIVSGLVKDGDCVMVKESPKMQSPVLLTEKKTEQRGWEPIQKRKVNRATKKKRKFKKRKK